MVGVILSSYVAIAFGVLLALVGFLLRRRGSPYGRYLLGAGVVLVLAGLAGLLSFLAAFG